MRLLHPLWLAAGLALVLTGPTRAQRSLGGFDLLLQNEGVHKELKLSEEQLTKVKEVIHQVRQKHKEELEKQSQLSPEERKEKAQVVLEAISQETLKSLTDTLKPEQIRRLKQIHLQLKGIQAFFEADVGKALKLTDEQRDKLKTIEEDAREEFRKATTGPGKANFQEALKKAVALRKEALDKAIAVLTPEQKKTWKDLAGAPYEIKFDASFLRRPLSERDRK
jgi:Spy/CpxP family protein refolding chaperone